MQKYLEIIRRPLNTIKSNGLTRFGNTYAFEVSRKANKHDIRDAIQRLFEVKVLSVRTLMQHGKCKRVRGVEVKKPNWKKAYVVLATGQSISLFETGK